MSARTERLLSTKTFLSVEAETNLVSFKTELGGLQGHLCSHQASRKKRVRDYRRGAVAGAVGIPKSAGNHVSASGADP
jgi:hypothetical protein